MGVYPYRTTFSLNYVYDPNTLAFVAMQQPVINAGQVTATVTNDGTFAKETGGNLATIVTNTGYLAGFHLGSFDYISYTSGATTDTYVYKSGGSGGTTVGTVTVTWTDGTKSVLSNVART